MTQGILMMRMTVSGLLYTRTYNIQHRICQIESHMPMYFTSSVSENIWQGKHDKNVLTSEHCSWITLDPIGIVPLILNINDHMFIHNLVICKALKQPLIVGLDIITNRSWLGCLWNFIFEIQRQEDSHSNEERWSMPIVRSFTGSTSSWYSCRR